MLITSYSKNNREKPKGGLIFKMNLKKTFSGFSLYFFIFLIVFLPNSMSKAMIRDITLDELVKKSDVIVIADGWQLKK